MSSLVIIGAGFSGTVAAIEFLRTAPEGSALIILNRSGQLARGLAYGTNSAIHLLNVPAGNMSAIVTEPDSYLDYCKSQNEDITSNCFTPRKMYGEYLESLLTQAEADARGRVDFKQITGNAKRVSAFEQGAKIELDNREEIFADQVILALGHFPPLSPSALQPLQDSPRYIKDPWSKDISKLRDSDASVLLVGGGLTALDVISSLKKSNHSGDIIMLSRRGLLPIPHRVSRGATHSHPALVQELTQKTPDILCYFRIIRNYISNNPEMNWRDVIAAIRPVTTTLWLKLPDKERRRFLRHLQPYWDVHRHRVAPTTYAVFDESLKAKKIKTLAGRVHSAEENEHGARVSVRLRGDEHLTELSVTYIINCTGPNSNPSLINEALIRNLVVEELVSTDLHGLGINVNRDMAVIDPSGKASTWLSYVGPMLKAKLWEATAVPELRIHASAVAKKVVKLFSQSSPTSI
ncbi:FAD/NAD(P)-binding protein [Pseudomonas sp. 18058]|uniref:FAD/NAD(P)-binding protein n=1 Tax=Pseudomonas sp. 18058 TaxID=2681406 RepID=UPI001357D7A7|nr:FAD/NAD(P)-binding protein [Pseudomonas sp. 18058]